MLAASRALLELPIGDPIQSAVAARFWQSRAEDRARSADKFSVLSGFERIWAVGAVHGQHRQLVALHDQLALRFQPAKDRLIYLGNYFGHGTGILGTMDELLSFRRKVLAEPGVIADDIVYLRGHQEEMWRKLLQLHFAREPYAVLKWMEQRGIGSSIAAYGSSIEDAFVHIRAGNVSLTRYTRDLSRQFNARPGHSRLFKELRHAAYSAAGEILLVHTGFHPDRQLRQQGDHFWWCEDGFEQQSCLGSSSYQGFSRIIRGYSRHSHGFSLSAHTASLDGGCGFGGPLLAACFDTRGHVVELLHS